MEKIAEMLKTFGPDYELKFRMDYFSHCPGLVMELVYANPRLNERFLHQHEIPFIDVEHLGVYGPQIINDMFRAIEQKVREKWGAAK